MIERVACSLFAVWLLVGLASFCPGQTNDLPYQIFDNYQAYIACKKDATVWFGERVALVLEGEKPVQRDAKVMSKLTKAFDGIFDAYDRVTGRKPELTVPLNGKIRIEVSSKVGGGLAHHGRLGIAVGPGFFRKLYERFERDVHTVDQVFFYEIARNYWMSDMNPRIDYHTSKGPSDYGWWTVGFNNAMSVFMPSEVDEIDDMYYFGSNGEKFSQGLEEYLITYIQNPRKYNWENSWNVPLVPWKERSSVNGLMSGLLIRLHRDHGGNEFIHRLYQEIPKREKIESRADRQGARDNFYEAASLAAKKDLFKFFHRELRWKISQEARKRTRSGLKQQKKVKEN